jgi:hypothetical protein
VCILNIMSHPSVTAFFDHLRALESDADYPYSLINSSSSSSSSSSSEDIFLSKSSQPFIRPKQRLILFNWMAIVCQDNLLKRQTYHSAVSMVDRYTRKRPNLKLTEFQCLGAACVSLASKLEEIHPPSLEDLSEASGGYVAKQDISNMEFDVCSILGWRLLSPTVVSWLGALCYCVGSAADAASHLLTTNSATSSAPAASTSSSSITVDSIVSTYPLKVTQKGTEAGGTNQKKRKRDVSSGNPRQSSSVSKRTTSMPFNKSSDTLVQTLLPFKKKPKDANLEAKLTLDTSQRTNNSSSNLPLPSARMEHTLPVSKSLFAALLGCSGKLTENGDPHIVREIPHLESIYNDVESSTLEGKASSSIKTLSLRLPLVSSRRVFPKYFLSIASSSSHHPQDKNSERATSIDYSLMHATSEFVFISSDLSSSTSRSSTDLSNDDSSLSASSQGTVSSSSSQVNCSQTSSKSINLTSAKPTRRGRSSSRKNCDDASSRIDHGVIDSSQESSFSASLPSSMSSFGEPSSSRLLSTLTSLQNKLPSKLLLDCFTVADACVFHVNVASFPPSILAAAILLVVLRRYKEEAEVAFADETSRKGHHQVQTTFSSLSSSSPSSSFLGTSDSDVLMRLHNLTPLVVEVVRHAIFDTVRCTTKANDSNTSFEGKADGTADVLSAHPKGGSPTNSNRVSKCYDDEGLPIETSSTTTTTADAATTATINAMKPIAPISIEASLSSLNSIYIPTTLLSIQGSSLYPEGLQEGRGGKRSLREDVVSCISTLDTRWNILVRAIVWVYSMTDALPSYTPHVDIVSCPNELLQFVEKSEWQLLQTSNAALYTHVSQKLVSYEEGAILATGKKTSAADNQIASIVFPEIGSSWHGQNSNNVEQLVEIVLDTLNKLHRKQL